jgi:exonuclease SbcC
VRPVRLTVRGLRSYRGTAVVDFRGLSLVALIGDTGAGKSSLIEGLCFALYGSTTWDGRSVGELVADGADQVVVELEFRTGGDTGDTWTVTRSHRRGGGQAVHRLVSDGGAKVDGAKDVNQRIAQLLGLTKEQFLKAVVMPQGRFEELLRASPGQRTQILKGVFRLDALDAVKRAAEAQADRWRDPVTALRTERLALPADPAAALGEAEQAARRWAATVDALEVAQAHVAAATEALELARGRATALRAAAARVEALGTAIDPGAAAALLAADDELARATAAAEEAATAAAAHEAEAAAAATAALAGFATRDDAVGGRARLAAAASALAELEDRRRAAAAALAALDAAPPPAAVDAALVAAARDAEAALTASSERRRAAAQAEAAAVDALAAWRAALDVEAGCSARRDELAATAGAAKAARREAERALEQAEAALSSAAAALDDVRRRHAAAAAATGCQAGDECPVCGRALPDGFVPRAAPDLDDAAARLADADATVAAHRRAVRAAVTRAAQASSEHDQARRQAEDAAATCAARARAVAELLGAPPPAAAPHDADAGGRALVPLRDATARASRDEEAAAAAARDAAGALAAAQATSDERRARWAADHQRESEQLAATAAGIGRQRRALAALPAAWRPAPDAAPAALSALADDIDAALAAHQDAVARADDAATARRRADAARNELSLRREREVLRPAEQLTRAVADAHAALVDLAALVDPPPGVPPAPAGTAPGPRGRGRGPAGPPDLAALHAGVEQHRRAAAEVTAAAARAAAAHDAEADVQERQLAAVLAEVHVPDAATLPTALGDARAEARHARHAQEEARRAAARATRIDEALAIATPHLSALQALAKLLTDGKFIGHVMRSRETALLVEASRTLRRLSGDRFGFQDGFGVVDRRSGQVRGADTLSGGERFQASLALALALVEIATRGGGQLDAVFVDEGFGSLDAASLGQALDALGDVAVDGKLVALVSHLRQVAEHVDQVLLVERDDATGSTVRLLDEAEREALLVEDARSRMTT